MLVLLVTAHLRPRAWTGLGRALACIVAQCSSACPTPPSPLHGANGYDAVVRPGVSLGSPACLAIPSLPLGRAASFGWPSIQLTITLSYPVSMALDYAVVALFCGRVDFCTG
jgi:hypothetical protein